MEPKEIVAQGYDAIVERQAEWAGRTRTDERERYTAVLLNALSPGARVLELGCGVGVPTTQCLAQCFAVTGVDISAQHIALVRRNVPAATFVQADPYAGTDDTFVIRLALVDNLLTTCPCAAAVQGAERVSLMPWMLRTAT